MINLQTHIDLALGEVRARIIEEAERRGKVATRGTINGIATRAFSTSQGAAGQLEADEHWKYVGNGRGPGRMPPVEPLQRWVNAKGLELSAWAVAKTIAKVGSKDYRNGAPNVFLSGIDDFERGGGFARMENEVGFGLETYIADQAVNTWRNG